MLAQLLVRVRPPGRPPPVPVEVVRPAAAAQIVGIVVAWRPLRPRAAGRRRVRERPVGRRGRQRRGRPVGRRRRGVDRRRPTTTPGAALRLARRRAEALPSAAPAVAHLRRPRGLRAGARPCRSIRRRRTTVKKAINTLQTPPTNCDGVFEGWGLDGAFLPELEDDGSGGGRGLGSRPPVAEGRRGSGRGGAAAAVGADGASQTLAGGAESGDERRGDRNGRAVGVSALLFIFLSAA